MADLKATPHLIGIATASGIAAVRHEASRVPGRCPICIAIIDDWKSGEGAEAIFAAWLRAYDAMTLQTRHDEQEGS